MWSKLRLLFSLCSTLAFIILLMPEAKTSFGILLSIFCIIIVVLSVPYSIFNCFRLVRAMKKKHELMPVLFETLTGATVFYWLFVAKFWDSLGLL